MARATAFGLLALLACGTLLRPAAGHAGSHCGGESARYPSPDYATREFDSVRRLRQQGVVLPLQTILERARRHRSGRVLDTQLEREHDRYIYAIQLVDHGGRVWEMKLDASSGELLEDHPEE